MAQDPYANAPNLADLLAQFDQNNSSAHSTYPSTTQPQYPQQTPLATSQQHSTYGYGYIGYEGAIHQAQESTSSISIPVSYTGTPSQIYNHPTHPVQQNSFHSSHSVTAARQAPVQFSAPEPPKAEKSETDASSIVKWPAAVKHVARLMAQQEELNERISKASIPTQ